MTHRVNPSPLLVLGNPPADWRNATLGELLPKPGLAAVQRVLSSHKKGSPGFHKALVAALDPWREHLEHKGVLVEYLAYAIEGASDRQPNSGSRKRNAYPYKPARRHTPYLPKDDPSDGEAALALAKKSGWFKVMSPDDPDDPAESEGIIKILRDAGERYDIDDKGQVWAYVGKESAYMGGSRGWKKRMNAISHAIDGTFFFPEVEPGDPRKKNPLSRQERAFMRGHVAAHQEDVRRFGRGRNPRTSWWDGQRDVYGALPSPVHLSGRKKTQDIKIEPWDEDGEMGTVYAKEAFVEDVPMRRQNGRHRNPLPAPAGETPSKKYWVPVELGSLGHPGIIIEQMRLDGWSVEADPVDLGKVWVHTGGLKHEAKKVPEAVKIAVAKAGVTGDWAAAEEEFAGYQVEKRTREEREADEQARQIEREIKEEEIRQMFRNYILPADRPGEVWHRISFLSPSPAAAVVAWKQGQAQFVAEGMSDGGYDVRANKSRGMGGEIGFLVDVYLGLVVDFQNQVDPPAALGVVASRAHDLADSLKAEYASKVPPPPGVRWMSLS